MSSFGGGGIVFFVRVAVKAKGLVGDTPEMRLAVARTIGFKAPWELDGMELTYG
jgi:hypothetical protein